MKIYCKPYEDRTGNLNGKVVGINSNKTGLNIEKINNLYKQVPEFVLSYIQAIDNDKNFMFDELGQPIMIPELDEDGNFVYNTIYKKKLKDCVVEFEVDNKIFLNRSIDEMFTSTYWTNKIGIQRNYGEETEESKAYKLRKENEELKSMIDFLMMENLKSKGVI